MADYPAFQFTLDTARARLLELEHDVANASATSERASHVFEATAVVKATALGRYEGPALVNAARDFDQTAGRRGITADVQSVATQQSLDAAWGAFERNPFENWTGHDLNDDLAYFAGGARVYRQDLVTMTEGNGAARSRVPQARSMSGPGRACTAR